MKKITVFTALSCVLYLSSCGPAAEDRKAMHRRAKVFQDSIANVLQTSMDEAAAPGPNAAISVQPGSVQPVTPATAANTVAPNTKK